MIVLVTNREDLTADWLVLELHRQRSRFIRLNTEDYPSRIRLCLSPNDGFLDLGKETIRATDIVAIWWRRPVIGQFPDGRSAAETQWAAGEASVALEGFFRLADAHWVNDPFNNARTECKPEQLRRAAMCGLRVPATLVTNEARAVRSFAEA